MYGDLQNTNDQKTAICRHLLTSIHVLAVRMKLDFLE